MKSLTEISIKQLLFIVAGASFSFSLLLFDIGTDATDKHSEDNAILRLDIKEINEDVGVIRTDVAVIKAQISSLHSDVRSWYNQTTP